MNKNFKLCELYEYELSWCPFTKVSSLLRGHKKYLVFIRSDSSLDNLVFSIELKIYELVMRSVKQKTIFIVKVFKGKSLWRFLRFFHFPVILRKQLYLTFVFLLYSFQIFIAENFRGSKKNLKELPYDPAITLLGIHQKKMKTLNWKDTCTPISIAIYNSQEIETT